LSALPWLELSEDAFNGYAFFVVAGCRKLNLAKIKGNGAFVPSLTE
jgi:hypothetical protein